MTRDPELTQLLFQRLIARGDYAKVDHGATERTLDALALGKVVVGAAASSAS